jgi:short-subunit dehydrogenase
MPSRRLSKRPVVVVTGASAGVGRAVAQRFARESASLGLIARDKQALEATRAELMTLGANACAVACDMSNAPAVFQAADDIAAQLGAIDIWINDAMVTVFSPVSEITPEEFKHVTEVTYLGFVYGTMAALRHMRRRNAGVIVEVGSALAYRCIPLQAAYCGAKHAIRGFTDSLRAELLHENSAVCLTMVQLPAVNTPQFDWARTRLPHEPRPVPPVVQPEAVAEAIFRAAHEAHREYWVGRTTIQAILGNMLAPGLLDHYLARIGFSSQQRRQPVPPGRAANLFTPAHGHRLHGSFGDEASETVSVVSGETARMTAAGLALAASGVAAALLARRASGRLIERRAHQ